MQIDSIIDNLTDWCQKNICDNVRFLLPNETKAGKGYQPEWVNPTAFSLYIPTKDMLPPDVESKYPALCVQLISGEDDLEEGMEYLDMRIALAIWNPGTYEYEGTEYTLTRDTTGSKEILRFVNYVKTKLQETIYIEGCRIDRNSRMKFGFFTQEDSLVNTYPEWYAFITFRLKCGVSARNNKLYSELL